MFHKRAGVESSRGCDNPSRRNDTIIEQITFDSMPPRKIEKKNEKYWQKKDRKIFDHKMKKITIRKQDTLSTIYITDAHIQEIKMKALVHKNNIASNNSGFVFVGFG